MYHFLPKFCLLSIKQNLKEELIIKITKVIILISDLMTSVGARFLTSVSGLSSLYLISGSAGHVTLSFPSLSYLRADTIQLSPLTQNKVDFTQLSGKKLPLGVNN